MYLQITTKCNMRCAHCCYTCGPGRGETMSRGTWVDAIVLASHYTDSISIGGGEPTLHKEFFDILEFSLSNFSFVWLATNGTRTKTMRKLLDIINQEDERICQENQLCVALSLDYYHDTSRINDQIKQAWINGAKRKWDGFEIRDVSQGVIKAGRASITGVYRKENISGNNCVCSTVMVKPNGDIYMCGCRDSPKIGDVRNGIAPQWERLMQHDKYRDIMCHKALNLKKRR